MNTHRLSTLLFTCLLASSAFPADTCGGHGTRDTMVLTTEWLAGRSAILDGGVPVWKSEGHPSTTEVRAVKAGKLDLCPQNDVIAVADWMRANAGHAGTAIVDARLARFYSGEAAGRNHDGSEQ